MQTRRPTRHLGMAHPRTAPMVGQALPHRGQPQGLSLLLEYFLLDSGTLFSLHQQISMMPLFSSLHDSQGHCTRNQLLILPHFCLIFVPYWQAIPKLFHCFLLTDINQKLHIPFNICFYPIFQSTMEKYVPFYISEVWKELILFFHHYFIPLRICSKTAQTVSWS